MAVTETELRVGDGVRVTREVMESKIGIVDEVDRSDDEQTYRIDYGSHSIWECNSHITPLKQEPQINYSEPHTVTSYPTFLQNVIDGKYEEETEADIYEANGRGKERVYVSINGYQQHGITLREDGTWLDSVTQSPSVIHSKRIEVHPRQETLSKEQAEKELSAQKGHNVIIKG